jgi:hypothetical protein
MFSTRLNLEGGGRVVSFVCVFIDNKDPLDKEADCTELDRGGSSVWFTNRTTIRRVNY